MDTRHARAERPRSPAEAGPEAAPWSSRRSPSTGTEVVLHELAELRRQGRRPATVRVYADSPTALAALDVYRDVVLTRASNCAQGSRPLVRPS
ncbi:hypothetical protein [Streptomyces sp. 2A115]|uniref:hypothetical protein n=1 Tax=Streptomyces sp. 2A115 TaxID=3457439 RepID=UPI003FCFBB67